MRKTLILAFSALVIAGSVAHVPTASARHGYQPRAAAIKQFRRANDAIISPTRPCQVEAGNPYNPQTDYTAWSAWRAHGAWAPGTSCS